MKPGRLITDIAFRKEVQFQLEETKKQHPENLLPLRDVVKLEYYAIYVTQLQRYLIVDNRATIVECANGWGFKSLESLSKTAEYIARKRTKRHTRPKFEDDEFFDFSYDPSDYY